MFSIVYASISGACPGTGLKKAGREASVHATAVSTPDDRQGFRRTCSPARALSNVLPILYLEVDEQQNRGYSSDLERRCKQHSRIR